MKTYLNYIVKTKIAIYQLSALMEYLNNYQARDTIWDRYQQPTHVLKNYKKMQASSNSKYSTTKFFVCFCFPICIKHKPEMETMFFFFLFSSIVKHFKTELQQLNI